MGYLWNGSRISDSRHDFIDKVHGDVTNHPGSLVFLMGKGLRGFTLFSSWGSVHRGKLSLLKVLYVVR